MDRRVNEKFIYNKKILKCVIGYWCHNCSLANFKKGGYALLIYCDKYKLDHDKCQFRKKSTILKRQ